MKKIAIYLGVFVALLAVYLVAFSFLEPRRPGSAPGTVKAGYDTWHDIGQRIESSGMVLSVQSVSEDVDLARQAGVPEGSTLLLVDVTIENVRTEENLFYSPFFAVLFNAQASGRYAAELVNAGGRDLRSGHLAPGEVVRGAITFQVPAGERPYRFRYGEGIYTSGWGKGDSTGFPNWAPIKVRLQ